MIFILSCNKIKVGVSLLINKPNKKTGKSKTGKDTRLVAKESIKNDENKSKIVMLMSDEEKAKEIWLEEEVVLAPEALDVVSDTRKRPEYDVKYQQYVGTEDAYLQVHGLKLYYCLVLASRLHVILLT